MSKNNDSGRHSDLLKPIKIKKHNSVLLPYSHALLLPSQVKLSKELNLSWNELKNEWKKAVFDMLKDAPYIKFSNKKDFLSKNQAKIRTRTEALKYWEDCFDYSMTRLEELLDIESRLKVRKSVIKALVTFCQNNQKSKSRNLKYQIDDLKLIQQGLETALNCIMDGSIPKPNQKIMKELGSDRSVLKFIPLNAKEYLSTLLALTNETLLQKEGEKTQAIPHEDKRLRNYITAMEEGVFEFICENSKEKDSDGKAVNRDEVLSLVLELFAGHGIEKTTDIESWKRNLRSYKKEFLLAEQKKNTNDSPIN